MAASIKISELNSLTALTDVDLFLVSDMETGTSRKISYNNLKSNVITDTASALSTLEGIVSQNKTDAETLVETVRVALQAAVDGNATSFNIADDGLDSRLQVLETDPVFTGILTGPDIDINNGSLTIASSGGVVSNVGFFSTGMLSIGGNASFTGNATFSGGSFNLLNGFKISDTAVTASADELNYVTGVTSSIQTQLTDIQTTITNLDIDIAPETLDSINELAAAMGDDPAFLTTLQGRVTTIENDFATQTELNTYRAEIEDRNLQLALAYDTPLFVELLNAS